MPKHQSSSRNRRAQPNSAQASKRSSQRLWLLGGLFVAFALRLYSLGSESLWYDETVSVVLARKSIPALIAHTAGDIHPPGYYLLLNLWQTISQPSLFHGLEFLFAWPSVWFGILVVALLFPLAARLCDRRVALLTIWLAAVNPFHIWYSQEVRMYTVGAALGLICLWLLLTYWQSDNSASGKRPSNAFLLSCYAICAALGLYVLYYFVFLLATLFLIALLLYIRPDIRPEKFRTTSPEADTSTLPRTRMGQNFSGKPYSKINKAQVGTKARSKEGARREKGAKKKVSAPSIIGWLVAHGATALLWLPWLPTFWQQATDPPVPPWRVPWQSMSELFETLVESLRVLLLGQSMDAAAGIWAVVALVFVAAFYRYTKTNLISEINATVPILLLYLFAPLGMIVCTTLLVTPLYHVRYLFTYAPPFMIIVAGGLCHLYAGRRSIGAGLLLILLTVNFVSLQRFWTDPAYRTDDHRAAVRELATNWRPGDAILVNAGWVYTALEVYWPTAILDSHGAIPPTTKIQRITSAKSELDAEQTISRFYFDAMPILYRTGSVDGAESLGWGSPESDFFPLSRDATTTALDTISRSHTRLWHYRLYDTVNDPDGTIRTWLDENAEIAFDQPYSGRDFLRLQRYDRISNQEFASLHPNDDVRFGDRLRLDGATFDEGINAGEMLYTVLAWRGERKFNEEPGDFNVSLRLYNSAGELVVQHDEALYPPINEWDLSGQTIQAMALAVPAYSQPGEYSMELVVYSQSTQEVLVPESANTVDGQRLQLGKVTVQPLALPFRGAPALATFDYIALIDYVVQSSSAVVGGTIVIDLVWLPQPNGYRDSYDVLLELRDRSGLFVLNWREPIGGAAYPSGEWPAERPVRDRKVMSVPAGVPPGEYTLTLRLERTSDGLPIKAISGWGLWGRDFIELDSITLNYDWYQLENVVPNHPRRGH